MDTIKIVDDINSLSYLNLVKKYITAIPIKNYVIIAEHGLDISFDMNKKYLEAYLELDIISSYIYFEILDLTNYKEGKIISFKERIETIQQDFTEQNLPLVLQKINQSLTNFSEKENLK